MIEFFTSENLNRIQIFCVCFVFTGLSPGFADVKIKPVK
jgi:hypothetical protein